MGHNPRSSRLAFFAALVSIGASVVCIGQPRIPSEPYQWLPNTLSNVDLIHTNWGVIGHNIIQSRPGGYWPRGSANAYVYGGGLWFGARKRVDGNLALLSVIGYNPNSGASWFTPGVAWDTSRSPNNYRLYRGTDYDLTSGAPLDTFDLRSGGAYWPIWSPHGLNEIGDDGYAGDYVLDTSARRTISSGAPVFLSAEDIVAFYHDMRLDMYEGEEVPGLPFGLQVRETSYSWLLGDLRDVVIVRYEIVNTSADTLFDSYLGMMVDPDIGTGANDYARIAIDDRRDDTLGLVVAWSGTEPSRFGYFGIDLLGSPEVDESGFIRAWDGDCTREVGLATFQNWTIEQDPRTPGERYEFMAAGDRDPVSDEGDARMLVTTGPFHLRPGDTAVSAFALLFADRGSYGPGVWRDMAALIDLDVRAQAAYDSAFRCDGVVSNVRSSPAARESAELNVAPQFIGSARDARATVRFARAERGAVRLRLLNAQGSVLLEQDLGTLFPGEHRATVDGRDLPSGLYFVVVDGGGSQAMGKLLVQH